VTDLFRKEALEHQQQQLVGTIILRRAWSTELAAAVLGVLLVAVLVVACTFGFDRRETLAGQWVPEGGLVHATTPQAGVIEAVRIAEGQSVRQGDVMFVLANERDGLRGTTSGRVAASFRQQHELLAGQLRSAEREAELNRRTLAQKLERTRRQLDDMGEALALQARRARLSQEALARYATPEYEKFLARTFVEERQADAIEQSVRLATMRREQAALLAEAGGLQAELEGLPLRTERELAGLRGALARLQQNEAENDTRYRWEIKAPRAGRVGVLNVEAGQAVTPGMTLASLADEGAPMEAVLYAPARAAGLLKAGMPATLRFDALPHQKFGQFAGVVRAVSGSPVPPGEPAAAANAPMYRVRISLGTQQVPPALMPALKPGTRLEGTVTLEHRRFVEWAVEPLLAARGRV
jgi:membrane fusion protein